MYNEYLIIEIQKESEPSKRQALIGMFYKSNLNLISMIAKEQSLSREDYYDYMQLGYDALLTALGAYRDKSAFPFLSYFRRSFKHEIYKFNLEFHSPMRVKSPWYFKDYKCDYVSFEQSAQQGNFESYYEYDDAFKLLEDKMLHETLLKIMHNSLNSFQFYVLFEIFWGNQSKKAVAAKLQCNENQVRYAYTTALRTLKKLDSIKCIACDLFGISV